MRSSERVATFSLYHKLRSRFPKVQPESGRIPLIAQLMRLQLKPSLRIVDEAVSVLPLKNHGAGSQLT